MAQVDEGKHLRFAAVHLLAALAFPVVQLTSDPFIVGATYSASSILPASTDYGRTAVSLVRVGWNTQA
jgi:hypothetical protein